MTTTLHDEMVVIPLGPVLSDVVTERAAQDVMWGEQNHHDGTSEDYRPVANLLRAVCEDAFAQGHGTWRHILAEEVHEAFAETDPKQLRAELIQVAAVCIAWAEAIDRRTETEAILADDDALAAIAEAEGEVGQ